MFLTSLVPLQLYNEKPGGDNSYLCIKGVMKAFVARGVTLGLETSVESHNTLGSKTVIMPVVHTRFYVWSKF
jgi:translation elongation factor EF-Tu-like GTPase